MTWSTLFGIFILVSSLLLSQLIKNRIIKSYKLIQNSRKFEHITLTLPICGVLILNQAMFNYIIGDSYITSYILEIIGIQWYWIVLMSDSVLLNDYKCGELVGITCSSIIIIPITISFICIFSAIDVIHSYCILIIGIKLDCIPSRIVEYSIEILFTGINRGQCSELCGILHGLMPSSLLVL